MKKNILLFSLAFLLTGHSLVAEFQWNTPVDLIKHSVIIGILGGSARLINFGLQKTGKQVPYTGNAVVARMITAGMVAILDGRVHATNTYKRYKYRNSSATPKELEAVRYTLVKQVGTNILLKTTVAPLLTEGIVRGTKHLLYKFLEYVPLLKQKCAALKKDHPTITKAAAICAEETYRTNINNLINDGIDGLTYNNGRVIEHIRRNSKITFLAFSLTL